MGEATPFDNALPRGAARRARFGRARKRPDFVLKLYRMLKECPELITWENGLIVMPSPSRLERILPNYFRHGKFTSFQRQLNNFGFRKYAEAGKGTCVYVRDDLSGLPAEALLDLRRKPGLGDDDDGAGANGGGWAVLDPSSAMAARYSAHAGGALPPACSPRRRRRPPPPPSSSSASSRSPRSRLPPARHLAPATSRTRARRRWRTRSAARSACPRSAPPCPAGCSSPPRLGGGLGRPRRRLSGGLGGGLGGGLRRAPRPRPPACPATCSTRGAAAMIGAADAPPGGLGLGFDLRSSLCSRPRWASARTRTPCRRRPFTASPSRRRRRAAPPRRAPTRRPRPRSSPLSTLASGRQRAAAAAARARRCLGIKVLFAGVDGVLAPLAPAAGAAPAARGRARPAPELVERLAAPGGAGLRARAARRRRARRRRRRRADGDAALCRRGGPQRRVADALDLVGRLGVAAARARARRARARAEGCDGPRPVRRTFEWRAPRRARRSLGGRRRGRSRRRVRARAGCRRAVLGGGFVRTDAARGLTAEADELRAMLSVTRAARPTARRRAPDGAPGVTATAANGLAAAAATAAVDDPAASADAAHDTAFRERPSAGDAAFGAEDAANDAAAVVPAANGEEALEPTPLPVDVWPIGDDGPQGES